jgi:Ni/Co efflux regulator RcnB
MEENTLLKKTISSLVLLGVFSTPLMALAQHDDHHDAYQRQDDHHDAGHQQYVRHNEWRRGYHMRQDDWNRGQRVDDWRSHHLRQPPRGYEWREVDGNYVMAAVATGIVASVIAASAAH